MSDDARRSAAGEEVLPELGRLGGPEELDVFLQSHPEFVAPEIVEQISGLVRQRVRVDVEEALRLAEAGCVIAERLGDPSSLGQGFRAKANAQWFKGNCREAVELFERAAASFETAGLPSEVGRTLSSSIQALSLLGEYERAFAVAARAREIFTALGDDWRKARLELNVANIHHRQDRFAEALANYERAYEELLVYKDDEGVGVALHNIAVCLIMLNDFERAVSCYERVRELCRANSMPLLELQADYNIAYLYFLRGEYDTAIEALTRTRQLARDKGDEYHTALCDLDQAEIYLELNLTEEAARISEEARAQFEAQGMGFETGRSVANLAVAMHRQMDSAAAVRLFAEARTIFERENNQAWQALINLYHAMVLSELRRYDEARDLCVRAKVFFGSVGLDRREIVCDLLLARISLETGYAGEARSACQAVLQRLATVEAPLFAFQAHLLLGHAERILGDWRAAYQSYNSARSELEALRASVQGDELKISFLKDKVDVYESLVELCLDQRSAADADTVFRYIEQAKSRSLADLVYGRSRPSGFGRTSGSGGEGVRQLKGELNWLYHRIELEQTSRESISIERINSLRAEARRKEDEFLRIVRELDAVSARPEVLDSAPMEPHQIRAALRADAAIVEYFQTGKEFVAAVIGAVRTTIVRLAPVRDVTARIRMLEFQLSKFRLASSYSSTFEAQLLASIQNRLHELWRDLIEPLLPAVAGRHLIIIPHGVLHYVPFHALFNGEQYLIDRFTISYAPSASIYAMCHRKPANRQGVSLLMGVLDDQAPFIEPEIQSVAAVVPEPKVFLGESATGDVLRELGPEARIIHIATHGFFRRDNAMFSSVRLAGSYMTLYDLYDLELPVTLVALSGCGTGLSVVAPGDELLGLTRGLLSAGAQSVLLSLWDVHDRTTAGFMSSFYSHLHRNPDKGAALQAAMLETRERQPHPYFWGPFVLVGKVFES